ncbi:MAG: C25 family cysteine peptidase [Planctomycetes bacterium]|nr:C25 family cysteine peptidase [Planctomycetota bacterium]
MRTRPTPTPKDQARIAYAHRPRVKTEIPGPKARHATRQASLPAKATVPAPAPSTAALARDTPSIGISSIAILDADPNSIPKYGKVELQVVLQDVEALSEKYYEPDPTHGGVNLSATFTPVSGGPQQHVNGFYDGTDWLVRFTPNATGLWNLAVTVQDPSGVATASGSFTVVSSSNKGFVRIAGNYLAYEDGSVFFGIGHNSGWQHTIDTPSFAEMAAHGENLLSFWLTEPWKVTGPVSDPQYYPQRAPIENTLDGIGNYNQAALGYLDAVIDDADVNGIYLLPSLWPHDALRMQPHAWSGGNWDNNAYSTLGGGLAAKDFYLIGSSEQWRYQRNFYRYLIARFGYSPRIIGWVGVVEVDGTNGYTEDTSSGKNVTKAWAAEVRDFFAALDRYRVNGSGAYPLVISKVNDASYDPGLGLRSTDRYFFSEGSSINNLVAAQQSLDTNTMRSNSKPAFHTEFGGNVNASGNLQAAQPLYLHNGAWGGLSRGACMTPLLWTDGINFPFIGTPNATNGAAMQDHLQYMGQFMAGIDYLNDSQLKVQAASVTGSSSAMEGWATATPNRGYAWMRTTGGGNIPNTKTLNVTGMEPGDYSVDWYDVWTDGATSFDSDSVTASSSTLSVAIPNNIGLPDVACKFSATSFADLDFGDTPDTYRTTRANNGARHNPTGPLLGSARTTESDGPSSGTGTQDSDDGISGLGTSLVLGQTQSILVTASASGRLYGWVDFNRDGDFDDSGEQVFSNSSLSTGSNTKSFAVPATANPGATYSRFRIVSSTVAALGVLSYGYAADGEVEDYAVTLADPTTAQLSGFAFEDANKNGAKDPGEPGIAGVTVYLDLDDSGTRDGGEPSTTTLATGAYSFTGLAAGEYRVAQELPSGHVLISPTHPLKKVGRADTQTKVYGDVWGEGDVAILGSYDSKGQTEILDISDPANPTRLSMWDDTVLFTGYPPVTAAPHAVADAAGARQAGARHIGEGSGSQFEDVALKDGILFASSNNGLGIHVVALTPLPECPWASPGNPVTIAHISADEGGADFVHTLYVDGDYLYFATNQTITMYIFDISNPAEPVFVSAIDAMAGPDAVRVHEVTVRNGRLYAAVNSTREEEEDSGTNLLETEVWDVSDPANPAFIGAYDSGYMTHTVWGADDAGDIVISAREPYPWEGAVGDVTIWSFQNPNAPFKVSTLNAGPLGFGDITAHIPFNVGNLLYVSWYMAGVAVFDIADPTRPVFVGRYDTSDSTTEFEGCWGVYPFLGPDRVLASDMQNGLFVLAQGTPGGHYVSLSPAENYGGLNFADAQEPADPEGLAAEIAYVPDLTVPADGGTTVNLNGVVTLGTAAPSVDAYAWSVISGPGTVQFGTPNAEDTTALIKKAGIYDIGFAVTSGPYTVHAVRRLVADDRFEPNDAAADAKVVDRGCFQNLFCTGNDYYRITVQNQQTVLVKVFYTSANGDLEMWMQDAQTFATAGTHSSSSSEDKVVLTNATGAARDYLIHVNGIAGSSNHYSMFIKRGDPYVVAPHNADLAIERVSGRLTSDANFVKNITQMAFGPDGKLYCCIDGGFVYRFAYDPSGQLGSKETVIDLASKTGLGTTLLGIAFHGRTMYVAQNKRGPDDDSGTAGPTDNLAALIRLTDKDANGIYDEPGEDIVAIARGIPIGDHQLNNLVIVGDSLYAGIGTRSSNGLGDKGWSQGESSYNGTVCWIEDLTQVASTDNAAGLPASPSDTNAGQPYSNTAANTLRVFASGTRNPYGIAADGEGKVWISVNERRSVANDALDDDFTDDRYDQFFPVTPQADFGYANGNWRTNSIATTAGFFNAANATTSLTHDNLSAPFVLHDPASPVGLGPHSSADGFAFYTGNALPLAYHHRAFVARFGSPWSGGAFVTETGTGYRVLRYADLVTVDPATGAVERIVNGLNVPLCITVDPAGNVLVADFDKYSADINEGGIWRVKPVTPNLAPFDFVWGVDANGSWNEYLKWSSQIVPNQWGDARYNVTIDRPSAAPLVTLDMDVSANDLTLGDKLKIPYRRSLTLTGDYTQNATGQLQYVVESHSPPAAGVIESAGDVALAGSVFVDLSLVSLPPSPNGTPFVVPLIRYTGTRTGTFGNLYWSGNVDGHQLAITYDDGNKEVDLTLTFNPGTTPVTIDSFKALAIDSMDAPGVLLTWRCASENENLGFRVWRRLAGTGNEWTLLDKDLVPGRLSDAHPSQYRWFDEGGSDCYEYRLESVDVHGHGESFARAAQAGRFEVLGTPTPEAVSALAEARARVASRERAQNLAAAFDAQRGPNAAAHGRSDSARVVSLAQASPEGTSLPSGAASRGTQDPSGDGSGPQKRPFKALKAVYGEAGVLRIPGGEFAAGFEPSKVDVLRSGRPLPVLGLNGGDVIVFGPGYRDRYTTRDALFLAKNAKPLLAEAPGVASGLFEAGAAETAVADTAKLNFHDVYFDWGLRPLDYPPWFSNQYLTNDSTRTFALATPGALDDAATLSVRIWNFGRPSGTPPHGTLRAFVNGTPCGEAAWNGDANALELTFAVPGNVLNDGPNTIDLQTPDLGVPSYLSLLHSMSITYRRVLDAAAAADFQATGNALYEVTGLKDGSLWVVDASDPYKAKQIAYEARADSGSFVARFRAPQQAERVLVVPVGAESGVESLALCKIARAPKCGYLAVGSLEYEDALKPLLKARKKEKLKPKFAETEALFDAYNFGRYGPAAIRNAVRDRKPDFLLLVGRSHWDYQDLEGLGLDPMVPTFLEATGEFAEAPCDALLGDGHAAVGRYPVLTPNELSIAIERTLSYKAGASGGAALMAADRLDPAAGDFAAEAEAITTAVPEHVWRRAYLGLTHATADGVGDALRDAANGEAELIVYVGHGSSSKLSKETIMTVADAAGWTGNVVFVQSTCTPNYFIHNVPGYYSIAEALLTQPQGGIAASLGTTTYLASPPASEFMKELLNASRTPGVRWGEALRAAQRALEARAETAAPGDAQTYRDLAKTESLLGDPALLTARKSEGK